MCQRSQAPKLFLCLIFPRLDLSRRVDASVHQKICDFVLLGCILDKTNTIQHELIKQQNRPCLVLCATQTLSTLGRKLYSDLSGSSAARMPSRLLASIQPLSKNTLLFILLSVLWYSCSFLSSSTSKALLSGKKIKVPTTTTHDDATLDHALVQTNGTAGGIQSALVTVKAPPLFPYPVSLTALQFLFVFAFSYLLSSPAIAHRAYRLFGLTPRRNAVTGTPQGLMGTLVMVNGAKLREMVGLSVFNVTGHAMTAAAIQMVPVSTVHTVKVST